jgi:hypothetical protein
VSAIATGKKQGEEMSKASSQSRLIFNRREALWLSATAGVGLALGRPARASDSIKTGVHQQDPATCSTPRRECHMANDPEGEVRKLIES